MTDRCTITYRTETMSLPKRKRFESIGEAHAFIREVEGPSLRRLSLYGHGWMKVYQPTPSGRWA